MIKKNIMAAMLSSAAALIFTSAPLLAADAPQTAVEEEKEQQPVRILFKNVNV